MTESMFVGSPWRRRLLAITLSTGLGFLVGEVFVRVMVGAPLPERLPLLRMRANPERGWEMVEGIHYTYQHEAFVNRLGLRNFEIEARRAGEVRVLVLGDSLVYGQGVGDNETLPFLLEEQLDSVTPSGIDWTVINSGHRAYDTRQELALLESLGHELDPDIVVLCWYWNDLVERDIDGTYERLKGKGVLYFDTGTRIEGFERFMWTGRELARRSALLMCLHDIFDRSQAEDMTTDDIEAGLVRLPDYMRRFVALCDDLDARPLFGVIPDPESLAGSHPSTKIAERALTLAKAAGIATVPLEQELARLAQEGKALPVIPFDGHYLPLGNRLMADVLAREIGALVGAGEH